MTDTTWTLLAIAVAALGHLAVSGLAYYRQRHDSAWARIAQMCISKASDIASQVINYPPDTVTHTTVRQRLTAAATEAITQEMAGSVKVTGATDADIAAKLNSEVNKLLVVGTPIVGPVAAQQPSPPPPGVIPLQAGAPGTGILP